MAISIVATQNLATVEVVEEGSCVGAVFFGLKSKAVATLATLSKVGWNDEAKLSANVDYTMILKVSADYNCFVGCSFERYSSDLGSHYLDNLGCNHRFVFYLD
jgi:hypothetical protein